jgi:hypothetical protein
LHTGSTTLNGTLSININDTTSAKLSVTGNLVLGSNSALAANLLGGFTGTSCVIAECSGTLSGTFATVPTGYQVSYTSTQIILSPIRGYADWAVAKGLNGTPGKENGYSDDPDHDGIPNIIEFLLDGNPLVGSHANDPTFALVGNHATFTFRRRDDAKYLNPVVEFSTDLSGPWTPVTDGVNGTIGVADNGAAPDTVTVSVPRDKIPRMFLRLKVTIPN